MNTLCKRVRAEPRRDVETNGGRVIQTVGSPSNNCQATTFNVNVDCSMHETSTFDFLVFSRFVGHQKSSLSNIGNTFVTIFFRYAFFMKKKTKQNVFKQAMVFECDF